MSRLQADMHEHGFDPLHPVLRWRGLIVDGRNRLAAAAAVGCIPVFRDLEDDDDPWIASLRANAVRRNLKPSQVAMIANDLFAARHAELSVAAAERQGSRNDIRATLPGSDARRPDAIIAQEVGISERLFRGARALKNNAPELAERVRAGELSVVAAEKMRASRHPPAAVPAPEPVRKRGGAPPGPKAGTTEDAARAAAFVEEHPAMPLGAIADALDMTSARLQYLLRVARGHVADTNPLTKVTAAVQQCVQDCEMAFSRFKQLRSECAPEHIDALRDAAAELVTASKQLHKGLNQ